MKPKADSLKKRSIVNKCLARLTKLKIGKTNY